MKIFYLLFFLILNFSNQGYSQIGRVEKDDTSNYNYLPVEGDTYIKFKIDKVSPLDSLIIKLNKDWQLIETGKGFYKGFTEDMFNIASRGKSAIKPLTEFYYSTKFEKGKIGAIYTMYLIGIKCNVDFVEKFMINEARDGLFELLKDKQYVSLICELLQVDISNSDLPKIYKIVSSVSDENICWPLINLIERYNLNGLNLNNEIPDALNKFYIQHNVESPSTFEWDYSFGAEISKVLMLFQEKYPESIKLERFLEFNNNLAGNYSMKFQNWVYLNSFLERLGGTKLHYSYENKEIKFISVSTARLIFLNYWENLTEDLKEKYK